MSSYSLCNYLGQQKRFTFCSRACIDISNSFYRLALVLGTVTYVIVQCIRMFFYQLMCFLNVIK